MSPSSSDSELPPIAIAHDYLTQRGGAERVVLALHKAFPDAPIYTTLYNPETTYEEFKECTIVTSPLNKVPLFRKDHRLALPLLPFFSSSLRVRARKAVVSTTGWAHGFNLPSESYIYCHSPARWIYLTDQYLGSNANSVTTISLKLLKPFLKLWDQRAARKQKKYVANSSVIKQRIFDVYSKNVDIIFPPFSVTKDGPTQDLPGLEDFTASGYFLIVSRLLPYKNVQHAIQAFNGSPEKLLVIGAGPMYEELKAMSGENIAFASYLSDEQMRYAYTNAKAVLAVSYEDFGITPLESGAFGKPVIALKAGGFLDTIEEGLNGVFIDSPTNESIKQAIETFSSEKFDEEKIARYIEKFSEERFINAIHRWSQANPE